MADSFTIVDEPEPQGPPFALRAHHCGLSVPNLEESIRWYREMLGFAVEFRTHLDMVPFDGAFLRRGDTRVELFEVEGARSLPPDRRDPSMDLKTHGVKHLSLEVSDLHAAFAFLTGRGVEVAMPIFAGETLMAGYIRDNSGNLIELVEHTDGRSAFRLPRAAGGPLQAPWLLYSRHNSRILTILYLLGRKIQASTVAP